jgi:hypothetical protein
VADLDKDRELVNTVAATRTRQLDEHLHALFDGVVQAGPFAGTKLFMPTHWYLGMAARLVGTLEAHLYPAFEDALARPLAGVVSVGASDGYYAIGMLRRRERLRAILFEMDLPHHETIRVNAAANGVADRIEIRGRADAAAIDRALGDLAGSGSVFLLADCEGAETEMLDPRRAPGLARAEILVECHDFKVAGVSDTLVRRFSSSHDVRRLVETARPLVPHPALAGMHEVDRLLLACEFRPQAMTWLWMQPKAD